MNERTFTINSTPIYVLFFSLIDDEVRGGGGGGGEEVKLSILRVSVEKHKTVCGLELI